MRGFSELIIEELLSNRLIITCEGREDSPGLPRTSSSTFRRAFFRAYVEKHCANPSHLGTIIEGSCPFVQSKHAL